MDLSQDTTQNLRRRRLLRVEDCIDFMVLGVDVFDLDLRVQINSINQSKNNSVTS